MSILLVSVPFFLARVVPVAKIARIHLASGAGTRPRSTRSRGGRFGRGRGSRRGAGGETPPGKGRLEWTEPGPLEDLGGVHDLVIQLWIILVQVTPILEE